MDWYGIKVVITEATGLERDALHLLSGLICQVALAIVLRRTLSSSLPWLLVLLLGVTNEWYDIVYEMWPDREEQWNESIKDMVTTMTLPTLLLLLARCAPNLLVRRPQGDDGEMSDVDPEPKAD